MKIVTWGERLGKPECPYLRRWVLNLGLFSVRLHHWRGSDDQRAMHDHAWWFVTLVLWGGYTDCHPGGESKLGVGSVGVRPSWWRHTVRVNPGGAWTLLLTGPETRNWGFYPGGRFRKRNKWFYMMGHHPCS